MKIRFLALLLLISGIQAISTSEFNMNFTSSRGKSLIPSNGQSHELLGKLYGTIESSRLNNKVEETENEYKEELLNITRKAQGGSSRGGGKKGKGGGSADVNRRPRRNSAPSLFSKHHFGILISLIYV